MSFIPKARAGRSLSLIAALSLCLSAAGCAKPYSAQLSAVEGLLSAARSGDEARAEALMPSLSKVSPEDRKKVLAGLAALGEHELSAVTRGPGGFEVSLRFGRDGSSRTIRFPVVPGGGSFIVGDIVATEEHIDIVPLE
jgi:hypothetical protein